MADGKRNDPYGQFNFHVEIDGVTVAGFSEVSGLTTDTNMIEYREGKLEGAREDFTRAVQILPTPMTWFTLGRVLEDQKNWGAAVSAYRAALQMNPNLPDAQAHLQTALQQISR